MDNQFRSSAEVNLPWPTSQSQHSLHYAALAAREWVAFSLCSRVPPRKLGYGQRIWLGRVPCRQRPTDRPDSWNRWASMKLHHNLPLTVGGHSPVRQSPETHQLQQFFAFVHKLSFPLPVLSQEAGPRT